MKQVALVVGTRPEVIKMAPIYRELRKSAQLKPVFLSTGQHRQMLDQMMASFDLQPEFDLNLMQEGQELSDLTARVITSVSEFLRSNPMDAMLVQGDTTTAFSASLAATYARIPLGHVEAGLRTYKMDAPWPEEMNRRLTSPIARWSFAPTEKNKANLLSEQIPAESIHLTGNSVIDALLWIRDKVRERRESAASIAQRVGIPAAFSVRFLEDDFRRWILVTGHRRESFGLGFESICQSLIRLTNEHPELGVLYPVHLNPKVREPVQRLLSGHDRIALIEPVGYEDFVWLMDHCYFILSDSGGVQEEAPSLGKPVLVMRSTTERPEGVEAGTCRLVGTDVDVICREANLLLSDLREYEKRSSLCNPFGDGHASQRIRTILENDLLNL